jgi:hypothetical protein
MNNAKRPARRANRMTTLVPGLTGELLALITGLDIGAWEQYTQKSL